jgi:hypothetical protein
MPSSCRRSSSGTAGGAAAAAAGAAPAAARRAARAAAAAARAGAAATRLHPPAAAAAAPRAACCPAASAAARRGACAPRPLHPPGAPQQPPRRRRRLNPQALRAAAWGAPSPFWSTPMSRSTAPRSRRRRPRCCGTWWTRAAARWGRRGEGGGQAVEPHWGGGSGSSGRTAPTPTTQPTARPPSPSHPPFHPPTPQSLSIELDAVARCFHCAATVELPALQSRHAFPQVGGRRLGVGGSSVSTQQRAAPAWGCAPVPLTTAAPPPPRPAAARARAAPVAARAGARHDAVAGHLPRRPRPVGGARGAARAARAGGWAETGSRGEGRQKHAALCRRPPPSL